MQGPLYDRDLDAVPPPKPRGPRPPPADASAKPKHPAGPAKGEPSAGFSARLASMGLVDMLGIGILLGFLAASLLMLAVSPSLAGFATLVGILLSVLLVIWAARRFGPARGEASAAISRSLGRAREVLLRWLRVDGVKAAVLSALCFASPFLLVASLLAATARAGYSLRDRDSVVWISFPVWFLQIGLIGASPSRTAASERSKPRQPRAAKGREDPRPSEILPVLAIFFGLTLATVPLNNPAAVARDAPFLDRLGTAIPGWPGPAFVAVFLFLVVATLGCYLGAASLFLMKTDGSPKAAPSGKTGSEAGL